MNSKEESSLQKNLYTDESDSDNNDSDIISSTNISTSYKINYTVYLKEEKASEIDDNNNADVEKILNITSKPLH
ncbi:1288_t:CDS:2 [Dentiscutata erythropus]|uniref:1288_t:CDS:1 n=1 Tax=Dentiscutata erythropus TaxID=1348616 RepID=A0A9N9AQC1_9GLOM|nr:1288_t:CDS:2 [Dentiscutata erythropus]